MILTYSYNAQQVDDDCNFSWYVGTKRGLDEKQAIGSCSFQNSVFSHNNRAYCIK